MTHTTAAGRLAAHGIDLAAPGGVEALLALHRSVFGGAQMSVDAGSGSGGSSGEGGSNGTGDGAAGTGGDGSSSNGSGAGSGGEGSGGESGTDTGRRGGAEQLRADLNRERDRRQEAERELQQLRDAEAARQREGEAEQTRRVRGELEGQLNTTREQVATLRGQLVVRDALDLAVRAGVAPERWKAFMKHVDLTNLEPGSDGTVSADALQARIDAGLDEAPEFRTVNSGGQTRRPAPGSGAGAAGGGGGDLDAAVARALAQMGGRPGGANGVTATVG